MLPLLFKIKETVQKLKFWTAAQKRTGFLYNTVYFFSFKYVFLSKASRVIS